MSTLTYTQPLLSVFLLLGFVGLVRIWRRRGSPKPVLLTAALAGIFLISWTPVDWLLAQPIEYPYRRMLSKSQAAQAIVVPASGIDPARSHFPVALADSSTYARCRYAAWLYREWRPIPVVVSGGNHDSNQPSFAAAMADILALEGVPREDILVEGKSRNTWENARFTAELLHSRKIREIALVVEADSMLRADLCFRKQGLIVVPAPFRHRSVSLSLEDLTPSWSALRRNELTLHEVLGLVWYKLLGRI